MVTILTIAGSDASGGAGIQGDLKTIAAHGAHGLSVITAVTAQNTTEILHIMAVTNVQEQIACLAKDIPIDGIKIGMLYTKTNVGQVIDFIKAYAIKKGIPVVIDPLMYSTTGKKLVNADALDKIIGELLPLATLVTPNMYEASVLTNRQIRNQAECIAAGESLYDSTKVPVLIKGGHSLDNEKAVDILFDGKGYHLYENPKLEGMHTHGTGCCLSSSITCQLAKGKSLIEAVFLGKNVVTYAIKHGYRTGRGEGPVDPLIHFMTNYVTMNDVANTCLALGGRPIMAEAREEMTDIVPGADGLVINLGTLNQGKAEAMEMAISLGLTHNKKILLDPVGCKSSRFRLELARKLLLTGAVSILKVNAGEGQALMNFQDKGDCNLTQEAYGVDSIELEEEVKVDLAKALAKRYGLLKKDFVVVVTGKVDVVAYQEAKAGSGQPIVIRFFRGGSILQRQISGTGCMLNGVIMTHVVKSESLFEGVCEGVRNMNRCSERADFRLKNKQHRMTYKEQLINELGASVKSLYLITDERLDFKTELLPKTEEALALGVKMLQYRAKSKTQEAMYQEASALKLLAGSYGVTFIINDDVRLAKAINADGVHLGITDVSVASAREELGPDFIIGSTAKTVDQAMHAQQQGADYIGVGALNLSSTKPDALPVTPKTLAEIAESVIIPIYGIGGINSQNLSSETVKNIDGIALAFAVYEGGREEIRRLQKRLALNR